MLIQLPAINGTQCQTTAVHCALDHCDHQECSPGLHHYYSLDFWFAALSQYTKGTAYNTFVKVLKIIARCAGESLCLHSLPLMPSTVTELTSVYSGYIIRGQRCTVLDSEAPAHVGKSVNTVS